MKALLAELRDHLESGEPCVLCSVVETRGSTPQKAGAAMLVFPDGRQAGTLGGGCVEAEVKQQALGFLHQAEEGRCCPTLFSFHLDDNYGWDDGLICGGKMSILADPIRDPVGKAYYSRFLDVLGQGKGCIEVVPLEGKEKRPGGGRILYGHLGQWLANRDGGEGQPDGFAPEIPSLAQRPRPFIRQGLAYLPILPRITVFIVGGGHVGKAVAELAFSADFDIEVLDDRETYSCQERFPTARRCWVGDIGQTLKSLAPTFGPNHFLLIGTRGHHHDEEALYHLATSGAGYLGMIGSKRKIRLIYQDLIARGIPPERLERVHAPLGFDIGSQTVPEIAISIVAELIAIRNLGTSEARPRNRNLPPIQSKEIECSPD